MRWNVNPRLVAVWLFVVALARFAAVAVAAEQPRISVREGRMAAIVAAIRVEERGTPTSNTSRGSRPASPTRPIPPTPRKSPRWRRRVVLQWDRISLRSDSFYRTAGAKVHREEVSAYDGKRTLTVVAGNPPTSTWAACSIRTSTPALFAAGRVRSTSRCRSTWAGPRRSMPTPRTPGNGPVGLDERVLQVEAYFGAKRTLTDSAA